MSHRLHRTSTQQAQAQWTVSGVVEAPVKQVWEALLDTHPALASVDKAAIRKSQPFTISIGRRGEGKLNLEVDTNHHSIIVQGEWWYRGVHSVEPHPKGSLLVYRVYNVAPGIGRWAAQLVQGRQHARVMKGQLQEIVDAIGSRLGCAAYVR